MIPQNTQKKSLLTAVKWIITLVACWFILRQLSKVPQKDWWDAFLLHFRERSVLTWLLIAVLLMPVNWGIEALKWQRMIRRLEQVNFITAYRAVLGGVTVSLFTPYRTGEFAGRIWVLAPENRVAGALVTVAQSFSQLLITLLAGTVAVCIFQPYDYQLLPLYVLLVALDGVGLLVYFRVGIVATWMSRVTFMRKWHQPLLQCALYSSRELLAVLLLSLMRYSVFVFQYYLLLRFFGVPAGFGDAVMRIAVVYLAGVVLPTFSFTEPLMRGSMAMALFQEVTIRTDEVLYATSLLWLLNLLLPALAGCFSLYRSKSVAQA